MKKILLISMLLIMAFSVSLPIFAEEAVTDITLESEVYEQTETQDISNIETETSEIAEVSDEGRSTPTTLDGWVTYIKEELLPIVVAALSVVAAIYVAISPILIKIKKASERFKSATEDVNAATGQVKSNKSEIARLEKELSEKIDLIERENADNHERLMDIEDMLCIGLGNMDELVIKGKARAIAKIGEKSHTWENAEGESSSGKDNGGGEDEA